MSVHWCDSFAPFYPSQLLCCLWICVCVNYGVLQVGIGHPLLISLGSPFNACLWLTGGLDCAVYWRVLCYLETGEWHWYWLYIQLINTTYNKIETCSLGPHKKCILYCTHIVLVVRALPNIWQAEPNSVALSQLVCTTVRWGDNQLVELETKVK